MWRESALSTMIGGLLARLVHRLRSDDDGRFVPSPLDASVRYAHGGGGDDVERELDEIRDEAERLEGRRDG
jgi:hypothetical protein